ncbi:glucosamine-6-phosphate deaminase [Cryobacterium levicorallinum]|uniref:Glucosamine-6-phosphate deaminase n=1 Tax=Cryobacterium levicorallinum TaxID=995038 RepID=A0A1I3CYD3_9MICO|nr:6-phosphogluconolactonase [Cryobacterium levicorallinum]TFB78625.1 glucosamine-6-phosphate deaminase [Cryobacterium levicorallinum]GEP27931.1 glucosamine-6-phosphate deaminase [Cryobacterium levicorallinum]SFH79560.1 glucosamine-6-phosphate deaminase [Cryobacterium levicorallinum]
MLENLMYDALEVSIVEDNDSLGAAVAEAFAVAAREALASQDEIAVILATGNSQLSFARAVRERTDIDWTRITVLHMDEYLGMSEDHSASFRRWMNENLASRLPLKAFEGVRGDHEPAEEELERYAALIRELKPSITVMGIGENGHLAFNDPPALFETDELIAIVKMDEVSRQQQLGEGHFPSLEETPQSALSLTIPALLMSGTVLVGVPEARKAPAVRAALEGPVTPDCPASILRRQPHARVFLDRDSAALLKRDNG